MAMSRVYICAQLVHKPSGLEDFWAWVPQYEISGCHSNETALIIYVVMIDIVWDFVPRACS
jgi:hypothetical protein